MLQQTLSIIKPDAVERNIIGKIIDIFEKNNLRIKNLKKIHLTENEAASFYEVHKDKKFFKDLCTYMCSGPVVVMVLEGNDAVNKNREIMGSTNPKDAKKGTLRNLFAISIEKNSVHGSDSIENAKKEISFFFSKN